MGIYKQGRPKKFDPYSGGESLPPAKAGEYRIRAKDEHGGAVVYIGETDNIRRRINEHMRRGKLKDAAPGSCVVEYKEADGRSTSRTRREHERRKIAQHSPALNLSRGGEGRPAKK